MAPKPPPNDWICPRCGFEIRQPHYVLSISHRCAGRKQVSLKLKEYP